MKDPIKIRLYIKVNFLLIASFGWIVYSIIRWYYKYPDYSNLIFAIFFGFIGMYLAYDQWFKTTRIVVGKEQIDKLTLDFKELDQAVDKINNTIQDKIKKLEEKTNDSTDN